MGRPVEATVVTRAGFRPDDAEVEDADEELPRPPPPDPVLDALAKMSVEILQAAAELARANRRRAYILASADAAATHEPEPPSCRACHEPVGMHGSKDRRWREPKLFSGYCRICYDAWRAAGKPPPGPERDRFEKAQRTPEAIERRRLVGLRG